MREVKHISFASASGVKRVWGTIWVERAETCVFSGGRSSSCFTYIHWVTLFFCTSPSQLLQTISRLIAFWFFLLCRPSKGSPVKDVPADKFIAKLADHFKRTQEIVPPEWSDIVKTAPFKQLCPNDEDWFYIRAGTLKDRSRPTTYYCHIVGYTSPCTHTPSGFRGACRLLFVWVWCSFEILCEPN